MWTEPSTPTGNGPKEINNIYIYIFIYIYIYIYIYLGLLNIKRDLHRLITLLLLVSLSLNDS